MNYWTDNVCTKIILIHSRLPICRVASCSVQGFQHDFLPALPSSLCLSSFCSYVKCTSVASAMQTETSWWINCLLRQWHLKLVRTPLALLNSSPSAWEDWWYSLLVDTTVKYASHNEECAAATGQTASLLELEQSYVMVYYLMLEPLTQVISAQL